MNNLFRSISKLNINELQIILQLWFSKSLMMKLYKFIVFKMSVSRTCNELYVYENVTYLDRVEIYASKIDHALMRKLLYSLSKMEPKKRFRLSNSIKNITRNTAQLSNHFLQLDFFYDRTKIRCYHIVFEQ